MKTSIEEARLRQEYLDGVLEFAPDAIVTLEADGIVTGWNKGAERLFGYTSAEAKGENIDDLVASGDPAIYKEAVGLSDQVSSNQFVDSLETIRYRKDGTAVNVILSGSPVFVNEKFEGSLAVYTDISERVRMEKALRESEQRYRSFVQNFQGIAFRGNMDFTPIFFHGAIEKISGYTEDEFVAGKLRWDQIIHPDDLSSIFTKEEKKLHSVQNSSFDREYRIVRKDGQIRWVHEVIQNICDDSGKPTMVQGAIFDITERVKMETALRVSEERFRIIFEQAAVGVAQIKSKTGEFVRINQKYADIVGYTVDEMKHLSFSDITHPDDLQKDLDNMQLLLDGEIREFSIEKRFYQKNGSIVWVNLTVSPMWEIGEEPNYHIAVVEDISERKQIGKALRDSESRFRSLIEQSPISTTLYTPDGKPTYGNPATAKLWNMTPELVQHIYQTYNIFEDRQLVDQGIMPDIQKGFAGELSETQLIRYDPKQTDPNYVGPVRWLQAFIYPVKDEDGSISEVVVMHVDITERKQAEDALDESHERLVTVLDSIDADVYVSDMETHEILFINQHMRDSFDGNLNGKICWQVFRGESGPCPHCTNDQLLDIDGNPAGVIEWEGQNPVTGRWYINYDRAIKWVDNRIVRLQVATDITERVRTGAALKESEQFLQNVFDAIQDGISVLDTDFNVIRTNNWMEQMYVQQAPLVGQKCYQLYQQRQSPCPWCPSLRTLETGEKNIEIVPYPSEEDPTGWIELTAFPVKDEQGQVVNIIEYVKDITERKLAEEEIRRYANRIEALLEIEKAITSSLDVDKVLKTIITELAKVVPYDSISLQILQDNSLKIFACSGFAHPDKILGLVFPLNPKFPNQHVIEEQASLAIEDVTQAYPHFRKQSTEYDSGHIRSWLGVPLISKGVIKGMIAVDRSEVIPFSETEINMAAAIASQAALAIDNASLFGEAQRRLNRLSSLRRIDEVITSNLDMRVTLNIILGQILQHLEVDAATVLLYHPDLQSLEYIAGNGFRTAAMQFANLRLGEGFAGRAALEQRIVRASDLSQLQTGFLRSPEFRKEGFVDYIGTPLITKGTVTGVLEIYHRHSLEPDREWMAFLETLAGQTAIAIDNIRLFEDLQSSNMQLYQAYDATIEGWAQALEMRDMETEGHSRRVVETVLKLARKLEIKEEELIHIRRGALLHDIGKMSVPDAILQKPGKLNSDEWQIMQQHPVYAYKWLSQISYLKPALDIPYCHHEKWDGTGYPRGLDGDEIPLAARVFAVVDVWDALLSDRPYRKAWTDDKVFEYIEAERGKHFDPKVVDVFLGMVTNGELQPWA